MHDNASQNPARMLAPLALVICAIAFFYVVFTSGSGDEGAGGNASQRTTTAQRSERGGTRQPRRGTYTVKTGDTLAGIAAKTGVSVDRLQELNPELDPQALVSGQKIKLRE